ncbi:MAG: response regulator transcription factor [Acidobacteriota bacterium]
MAVIPVVLIEDDPRMREVVRQLLDRSADHACAAAFGSVEEALAGMPTPCPQVALLDIHLPGVRGSLGIKQLHQQFPELCVLMLTVYAEDDLVFEAICNGAVGYLLKRTPPDQLLAAVTDAAAGGAPMSPEIARKVLRVFRTLRPLPREDVQNLTPQEARLLRLLADGHSYESAGANLDISLNTVRKYVRNIYEKLHVHSKSEAVSKALRAGLI